MKALKSFYSVYVSPLAVEIVSHEQASLAQGRFICRQANYPSLHRFARNLALHHHLPLHDYVQLRV
ncbi:MAG: hypothetical protein AAFQ89_06480 [Cyanobacteria bacterium J06626_18]